MKVKKAELKVEEVRLDATLQGLQQQCDAEAAQAEACGYETAASDFEEGSASRHEEVDTSERTRNYVKHQVFLKQGTSSVGKTERNETFATVTFEQQKQEPGQSADTEYVLLPSSADKRRNIPHSSQSIPMRKTSPGASPMYQHEGYSLQDGNISDIARFLA